jgi:hypothetical protein
MATAKTNINARLANVQSHLGVNADGIIGPVSLTNLEKSLGITPPPNSYSLVVSKTSIDVLAAFEISSAMYYNKKLKNPCWPGGESGITIGIGYDLGCNDNLTIRKDWASHISEEDLKMMLSVAKLQGAKAQVVLKSVQSVSIPLDAAKKVFYQVTLPKFAKLSKTTYPGIELLFADAQGALLSLLYNRGCSLSNDDRRKEMKAIKPFVTKQDYEGIAAQLRAMKRLWNASKQGGLIKRREDEARMVENSNRSYKEDELVRV